MRFEVFMVVKIQVEVFWVVTLCNVVVGYQHSKEPCSLCLQLPIAALHGITTQKTSACTLIIFNVEHKL
jgi:hypothetical protein